MKVGAASGEYRDVAVRLSRVPSRFDQRSACVGLAFVAASLLCLPCSAATTCELEIAGSLTPPWRDAVDALEPLDTPDGDCASLRLSLTNDVARVTFVTADGRRAERELEDPRELKATIDALLVTGATADVPSPRAPLREEPESSLTAAPRSPPDPSDSPTTASASTPLRANPGARFGLMLGARGGAEGLVSPVVAGFGTLNAGRWELGVWGAFEVKYYAVGLAGSATEPGTAKDAAALPPAAPASPAPAAAPAEEGKVPIEDRPSSAIVAGILVGRRWPLRRLAVTGAGRLGVAALQNVESDRSDAEIRVGAGLGVVFPPEGALRLRADLVGDVVPQDIGGNGTPGTPWWAFAVMLGVEVGGS